MGFGIWQQFLQRAHHLTIAYHESAMAVSKPLLISSKNLFIVLSYLLKQGRQRRGMGDASRPTFCQGDAMPLIPLVATNLCQSSQCHIQLSVDCHSSCMNCDIWR